MWPGPRLSGELKGGGRRQPRAGRGAPSRDCRGCAATACPGAARRGRPGCTCFPSRAQPGVAALPSQPRIPVGVDICPPRAGVQDHRARVMSARCHGDGPGPIRSTGEPRSGQFPPGRCGSSCRRGFRRAARGQGQFLPPPPSREETTSVSLSPSPLNSQRNSGSRAGGVPLLPTAAHVPRASLHLLPLPQVWEMFFQSGGCGGTLHLSQACQSPGSTRRVPFFSALCHHVLPQALSTGWPV